MPTIEIKKTDFDKFFKPIEEMGVERDEALSYVKGEMKGEDEIGRASCRERV